MQLKKFKKTLAQNKYLYLISLFGFFVLIYSNHYQQFLYDGYHYGIVLDNLFDFEKGKVPYKDFFTFYGVPVLILNSVILSFFDITNFNLIKVYTFIYSFSFIIFFILCKNFLSDRNSFFSSLFIFFIYPVIIAPWVNYFLFFFLLIGLVLFFSKYKILNYLSSIFFTLSSMMREGMIIYIFIFLFVAFVLSISKFDNQFKHKFSLRKIFIISLIILFFYLFFFVYLFNLGILSNYFENYFKISNVFLESRNYDIIYLIQRFFNFFFTSSYTNFLTKNYYLIFSIIFIVNICYIFSFIKKLFQHKNISHNESLVLLISIIALMCFSFFLHETNVFRLVCGAYLGIITILFLIKDTKFENQIYLIIFLFLLSDFNFIRKDYDNNISYKNYEEKINTELSPINFLKQNRFSEKINNNFIFADQKFNEIKKKCKVRYGLNLQKDVFFKILLDQYFQNEQYFPLYSASFYDINFIKNFDKNFFYRVKKYFENKEFVIFANKNILSDNNFNYLNLSTVNILEMPYNFEHKNKVIIYPKNCKLG